MTDEDLDAIEARAAAATAGPWATDLDEDRSVHSGNGAHTICEAWEPYDNIFIAHARADVPALVAEVRRLGALVERCRVMFGLLTPVLDKRSASLLCPRCLATGPAPKEPWREPWVLTHSDRCEAVALLHDIEQSATAGEVGEGAERRHRCGFLKGPSPEPGGPPQPGILPLTPVACSCGWSGLGDDAVPRCPDCGDPLTKCELYLREKAESLGRFIEVRDIGGDDE